MNRITWDINDPNEMRVTIMHDGKPIMWISVAEIIESSSRKKILQHVAECDRTPWLARWQDEKHQELVDVIKGL